MQDKIFLLKIQRIKHNGAREKNDIQDELTSIFLINMFKLSGYVCDIQDEIRLL